MTRVVAVVGPTATGKSDLGIALAQALPGGEVVNADSMQLYRGMDVGTAKLTPEEWHGVPHHVLDVWDVTEAASVAEYQRLARAAIDAVLARGGTPVLVGGSGLYVRAALDPLDFPGTDPAVRGRLEEELAVVGAGALHERLARVDPEAARGILPSNGRRIVRALEVIELTGRPFTATLPAYGPAESTGVGPTADVRGTGGAAGGGGGAAGGGASPAGYDAVQIGLDRADLDRRIDERVDRMWHRGLVDEVRRLEAIGLRAGRTASRALGYQQVLAAFDGRYTEDAARVETQRATRRFARRQRSWFRRDPRVRWLDAAGTDLLELALATLR